MLKHGLMIIRKKGQNNNRSILNNKIFNNKQKNRKKGKKFGNLLNFVKRWKCKKRKKEEEEELEDKEHKEEKELENKNKIKDINKNPFNLFPIIFSVAQNIY